MNAKATSKPITSSGRPAESEYKKARRALVRAKAALAEKQATWDTRRDEGLQFGYSPAELKAVAKARKEVAVKLNEAMLLRNELVRQQKAGVSGKNEASLEAQIEAAKQSVSDLMDQIYALPDLGQTFEAWAMVPDDMKSRPLGRPPLLLDIELVRAEAAVMEATLAVTKAEKSASPEEIAEYKGRGAKQLLEGHQGRPQIHEIGLIHRRIKMLIAKRKLIEEGRDVVEEQVLSANQVPLGRSRLPKEVKLHNLDTQIKELKAAVRQKEAALEGDDLKRHTLWKLRRDLKEYRDLHAEGALKPLEMKRMIALAASVQELELEVIGRATTKIDGLDLPSQARRARARAPKADAVVAAAPANDLLSLLDDSERAAILRAQKSKQSASLLAAIKTPQEMKSLASLLTRVSKNSATNKRKATATVDGVRGLDESAQIAIGGAWKKAAGSKRATSKAH